jgi:hypothetical protein
VGDQYPGRQGQKRPPLRYGAVVSENALPPCQVPLHIAQGVPIGASTPMRANFSPLAAKKPTSAAFASLLVGSRMFSILAVLAALGNRPEAYV